LRFLDLRDDERRAVEALAQPVLKNWNGIELGQIRVALEITGTA
jgi:hypothetical protein